MSREPESRWTVPRNWVWTTLSELGDIVAGGTPSTKEPIYWTDEVNWISPADLTGYSVKTIKKGTKSISRSGLANSSAKVMPAGSVHFSTRAPIGYVVISSEPLATNQGFKSLVPAPGIFNEYVYYYLVASREYARKRASGTTFLELSGRAFGDLPIPLAPTATQHKIVAKIEELVSKLDKGVESLKTARAKLNVYRQAVLKHAFEGKLTAQWREENKDKLEKPEQLLARIKQEREARYEHQLREWKAAVKEWGGKRENGKKPSKPRKPKDVNSARNADLLGALPVGWRWIAVSEIADLVTDGTHHTPNYASSGVPFISVKDVRHGRVNFDDCKFISRDEHAALIQRCHPEPGDLLITKSGTIGRLAIVPDREISLFVSVALVKIQNAQAHISSRWLRYAFEHHVMGLNIDQQIKGGLLKNYHLEDLRLARLPLCGIREQEELVRQVEEKFSALEELDTTLAQQMERVDAFRHSILKKAFSGQLVPQDPDDEPASILLERIKATKAARPQNNTRAKRRRTAAIA